MSGKIRTTTPSGSAPSRSARLGSVDTPPPAGLRVCHLIQYFEVGGIERMVLALGEAGGPLGVATTVVAYRGDAPFRQRFHQANIATAYFPSPGGLQVALSRRLTGFLRAGHFDVLHSHHLGPFMYGAPAAWLSGARHLHTEHSRELYDKPRRRLVGRLMSKVARVVTVSPELSEWHADHFGVYPEVVRNGVAVLAEAPPEPRGDGFVIACVARLAPEKDHATLIRAFARLLAQHAKARLVLVGDGPERPALEALVSELGLDGPVVFAGQLTHIDPILSAAHVVALSSLREGLPLALLEGMARARPAVATAVGGIPALLADGGGLTAPAGDEVALAAALLTYAQDPARRRRDGLVAHRRVAASYSQGAMVARYVAIYRELSRVRRR